MKQENLEFCFKGTRTYVHGTDIFTKMIEVLTDEMKKEKFDLSFHGVSKTNIKLSNIKPKDESLLKFVCKYTNISNKRKVLYGSENGKEIECRYEYPEKDICKMSNLNLDNKEILLNDISSYSFVENSVALNKYLLENLFPDADGKWYFTRFQIQSIPEYKGYPLKLVLKANFNFKLTKTEIFIADKFVGYIYFSLV